MDPLRARPHAHRRAPANAAQAQVPVPRNNDEGRRLAEMFTAQMEASLAALGSDGAEGADDGGDSSGDPLAGLGATFSAAQAGGAPTAGLLAALRSNPQLAAALGSQLLGAGGTALLNGDGLTSAATGAAGGLGALLNAPIVGGEAAAGALRDNVAVVAREARARGVSPQLAVAMMLVESGGNNRAVGDGGTSFGLYQLHEGGMLTGAGLTPQQAMDPATNARVALASLARTAQQMHGASPGEIAAASQRPADRVGYAAKVNAALARAAQLLGG